MSLYPNNCNLDTKLLFIPTNSLETNYIHQLKFSFKRFLLLKQIIQNYVTNY